MRIEHLEFLVEEPSMEAALRLLVPKIVGFLPFEVHPHQGKHDLLTRLPGRLSGYASWLPATYRIVVVVDRDDEDCTALKAKLDQMAVAAGLSTRSAAKSKSYALVNQLAIEELEAWYFGDWEAVRAAYPAVDATIPQQAKYRAPDEIRGGSWESFESLLRKAGYFSGGLRKIEAARAVASHMDPARNRSPSFCALRDVLAELAREGKP